MWCFFHLVKGDEIIRDEMGIEVDSMEQARREALEAIEELRMDIPEAADDWEGWAMVITDRSGAVLLSIPLSAGRP